MRSLKQALAHLWSLALVFLLVLPVFGQGLDPQLSESRVLLMPLTPERLEQDSRLAEIQSLAGYVALEGALDPNEYILGPGDLFAISVGGIVQANVTIPVSSSGVLTLPEAPQIQAAGRTLADVEREAVEALEARYANIPVSLILVQPRLFYVHISGAVPQPGRYMMLPVARVSDVLAQAHTDVLVAQIDRAADPEIMAMPAPYRPPLSETHQPALRNVQIVHKDGTLSIVDLTRYQTTGDTAYNPYLRDGDRITVPAYNAERDGVRVSGNVAWPGAYDLRADDTVQSLLEVAAGGVPLTSFTGVRLVRRQSDGSSAITEVDLTGILNGSVDPVALQAGDHVTVFDPDRGTAIVDGRVLYPGTYRIESGVTTVSELVAMAGGLRDDASVHRAVLERSSDMEVSDTEDLSAGPNNRDFGREYTDTGFRAYQQFDFFLRGFMQPWSGQHGSRVTGDIAGAIAGTADDIVLYDGDRLTFPRDDGAIFVTGQVPQPSYVTYVPGQNAEYYVNQAGGLGPGAGNIYVFTGSAEQVRQGVNQVVRPGDAVFVDRIEQLVLYNQQAKNQRTSLIISSVTAITAIVTTLVAVFGR